MPAERTLRHVQRLRAGCETQVLTHRVEGAQRVERQPRAVDHYADPLAVRSRATAAPRAGVKRNEAMTKCDCRRRPATCDISTAERFSHG